MCRKFNGIHTFSGGHKGSRSGQRQKNEGFAITGLCQSPGVLWMALGHPKSRQEVQAFALHSSWTSHWLWLPLGKAALPEAAQLCVLGQALQLEGWVFGAKGDLSASPRRWAPRRAGKSSCSTFIPSVYNSRCLVSTCSSEANYQVIIQPLTLGSEGGWERGHEIPTGLVAVFLMEEAQERTENRGSIFKEKTCSFDYSRKHHIKNYRVTLKQGLPLWVPAHRFWFRWTGCMGWALGFKKIPQVMMLCVAKVESQRCERFSGEPSGE